MALFSHGRYNLVATQTIPNRGKKKQIKTTSSRYLSQSKLYLVYKTEKKNKLTFGERN